MTNASRICHSTGRNALKRNSLPEHLCRGAREVQLETFFSIGFLDAPTDEEWNAKRVEMGMEPQVVKDPEKKR